MQKKNALIVFYSIVVILLTTIILIYSKVNTPFYARKTKTDFSKKTFDPFPCPKYQMKTNSIDEARMKSYEVCFMDISSQNDLQDLAKVADKLKSSLKILRILDIEDAIIPQEIGTLQNVQILVLESLEGDSELPQTLGNLTHLQELQVIDTELEMLPSEIGKFTDLRSISLSENPEMVALPLSVSQFGLLEEVYINANPKLIIPESLIQKELRKVIVRRQQITSIPQDIFALQKLHFLDYSMNEITEIPRMISDQTSLTTINFDYNKITSFPSVAKLINLRELNIRYNNVSNLPEGIQKLSKLQRLIVSDNQLTNESLIVLPQLTELRSLDLGNNKISKLPNGLEKLQNLQYLRLSGNPLNQSEVQNLRVKMPQTTIVF